MAPSPKWPLERYLPLLRVWASRLRLDPRLQSRFDGSDLVQETLLNAHKNLDRFQGDTEAELVKWLQQILGNVAIDNVRKERAQRRDVALEQSLQAAVADSSSRLEEHLADKQSSPSQRAERQELLLRLAGALDRLPEDQRDALIQRELLNCSVAQIAEQLGRSEKSVAGLIYRGKCALRKLLEDCQ